MMRAAEHIEFLLREVNHRSKNMLAVVQAVARQTARHAATPELFIEGFMARLAAIGSSHDLLVSRDWRGVQIADLTRIQFSQLDEETRARIEIGGDYLEINPRAAEAYGLALHELATNAVKYGALSTPQGRVSLSFSLDGEKRTYVLDWRESGGPPVVAPKRAGFGGTVLTRMAPLSIQGESRLDYAPEGVAYCLSAPLAQIVMSGEG
jgi:two-component sensor histidine kinase